jgi:hypothetical protein
MNIYSVYVHSYRKDKELILIKQGFSFIAAIFNLFWALYHKMWLVAIISLIVNSFLGAYHISYIAYSVNIAMLLVFGFLASEMREYYATRNGYYVSDIIFAATEEEAEIKYFDRTKTQLGDVQSE